MRSPASRFLVLALIVVILLSAAGCAPLFVRPPAEIGLLFPLTGEASFVADARNGAVMAVEEINEGAGGIRIGDGTVKLAMLIEDTASAPETAEAAAKTLLEKQQVVALLGPTSRSILAVVPLAREAGVVEISPFAGTTALDKRGGCIADECVFRTVSSDVVMGSGMAWYAQEALGAQKVAFFFSDDAGARSIQGVLGDAAQVLGLDAAGEVFFEPGKDSYADDLAPILAAAPDVIFFESSPEDAAVFLQDAQAAGFGGQWVGTDFVNPSFLEATQQFSEGVYGVNPGVVLDDRYAAWAHEYEQVIGSSDVSQFAANSYDAVNLVALALEKAGQVSRDAVRQNLRDVATPPGVQCSSFADCAALLRAGQEIDYDGISGPQDFNDFGDPVSPLKVDQVQSGELVRLQTILQTDIGGLIEQVLELRD
ncbi:MAG: branched-chain amino acid ABC transporter substrate-binding protein [Caldilineales bacterium]